MAIGASAYRRSRSHTRGHANGPHRALSPTAGGGIMIGGRDAERFRRASAS